MQLLLLALVAGPFQEIDGKILCPRKWVEDMMVKEDSLTFLTAETIPWLEAQIALQDSILDEQAVTLTAREEQVELLGMQLQLERHMAISNLVKTAAGSFIVGVVLGTTLTLMLTK